MPRRYASYPRAVRDLSTALSTIGAYTMGTGLVLVADQLVHRPAHAASKAPANPWGGNTLEWRTPFAAAAR